ncbi:MULTISPECIES: ABC transporter ATP-binding protein [unclassified Variovorax]|uniref:ABC transporter ATP-binding protein n=1 Tax=unclassified Variovorax TaxID=663243 RepID=UPI00257831E8|nr:MULTISPECIES: ABC transporter ATP-binding protein [unclassified Variovorax]MDM0086685.1 ABC transporter ATP-binding protein [Variovorax sp. J22G40]MDM0145059.1 ABC transporter ATP-binding protein [Variovorax sp. J2P1-31]
MTPLLAIESLNVSFGGVPAVRAVDLSIGIGETLALVGESGSGKSATALSILRLLPPDATISGRVLFQGQDLLAMPQRRLRDLSGREIGMVFQEPMVSLNPVLRVGEQIAETLVRHAGLSRAQARARTLDLIALVRLPDPARLCERFPHHLSGGQRQRIMIAIAVACSPRLLIADEPTTALDVTVQAEILGLLDSLKRELSMSLLLITHDLGLVSQWADRVHVMHDGAIVERGTTAEVLADPAHPYTRGLLGAALHGDGVRHYRRERLTEIRKHREPDDGAWRFELHTPGIAAAPPDAANDAGEGAPLLEVRDLHVRYRERDGRELHAVRAVSFDIQPGETLGLVGESGCGKSSLSRAITRLVPVASGRVLFDGADLTALSGNALARARRPLQFVFQDPHGALNPRHTALEMLNLAQWSFPDLDAAARTRAAREMLDQVGLPLSALHRYPHEFSGGQKQRLGIARALVQRPKLIVCDEPVSALDVSVQAQILNLLSELKERFGLTYLFISHDLAVVRYFTDRLLVMKDAEIVERGDSSQVWTSPASAYARTLIAAAPTLSGMGGQRAAAMAGNEKMGRRA